MSKTLSTCDQCGNMGYEDSWPFVQWHELTGERPGEGVMMCGNCWADALGVLAGRILAAAQPPATPGWREGAGDTSA